jgi:hypothetical protein
MQVTLHPPEDGGFSFSPEPVQVRLNKFRFTSYLPGVRRNYLPGGRILLWDGYAQFAWEHRERFGANRVDQSSEY